MKRMKKFGANAFKPKSKMAMPRMKKFADGGDVEGSFEDSFASQFKPERTDEGVTVKKSGEPSFSQAFREARKAGLKTFKWRGGTYGTKLASEVSKPAPKPEPAPEYKPNAPTARGGARRPPAMPEPSIAEKATSAMERNRSRLPSDRATNFRTQAEETGMTPEQRADKASDYARNIALMAGAGSGLGFAASAGRAEAARNVGRFEAKRASEAAAARTARRKAQGEARNTARREARASAAASREASKPPRVQDEAMEARRKRLSEAAGVTNSGRRFAAGGSVRGGGCEMRGKTRGKFV